MLLKWLRAFRRERLRGVIGVGPLVERVAEASPRVVVLTAPAGYGKSTFAAAYARTFDHTVICDCEDVRRADEFARRVVDALARSQDLDDVARVRLARGSSRDADRDLMQEYWDRLEGTMLFVLENADALHRIPDIHEPLAALAARASRQRTLAICTRRPLPAALQRALGARDMVRVEAGDLEVAEADVVALAAARGIVADAARAIARNSAGWPIVARLLIDLAADGRGVDILDRLDDVAFDELYDYVADEVLQTLPPAVLGLLIATVAVPHIDRDELRVVCGADFDAMSERRFLALPFVSVSAEGTFVLHPVMRAMIEARFPARVGAAAERALAAHEEAGNGVRIARIALARGDSRRAARAIDRLPTYVRASTALPECEHIIARLAPEHITSYPGLWIATMPFRRHSVDLETYLSEARAVYYCLPADADVRLRTDVLLHLASALYQNAAFAECATVVDEALETFARPGTEERAIVLTLVASLRGLQGRFSEARAMRHEAASIRRPDFLTDLGLQYVDAHEAIARGRYERGIAIIEESLRRVTGAKLPLYVAFTATNGMIFAWANGDEVRFARFLDAVERAMVPGIERGFTSLLAAAHGRRFVPDPRFESPVALAMAHLYAMAHARDHEADAFALAAAAEADRCRDPYLQVLAHAACALRLSTIRPVSVAAMLDAARRIESPELLAAARAVADGAEPAGALEPLRIRVRAAHPTPTAVVEVALFDASVRVGATTFHLVGKELELVATLALGHVRSPIARERILETLWPEIDHADAANNLRVTLSRMRRKIGADVVQRIEGGFRLSSTVTVDVREVESLARGGASDAALPPPRRAALSQAFDRVARGLPPRVDRIPWISAHRPRLAELAIDVGRILAQDALVRDDAAEALRLGHALVELDPLDEQARRIVLRAYAANDDWDAARRELSGYADLVRTELDAVPADDLNQLVRQRRAKASAPGMPASR